MNDIDESLASPRDASADPRAGEKIRILERHCDHLMGQLYHQVRTIRSLREQVAHLQDRVSSIEDCPKLLDQALQAGLRPETVRGLADTGFEIAARLGVPLPPPDPAG